MLPRWVVKNPPPDARDDGPIPGLGRSSGEGNGYPLQYSCSEIPWTEEPGRLQSMGLQRVGHDWSTEHRPTEVGEVLVRVAYPYLQAFQPL